MLARVYRGHCPMEKVYQSELGGDCRNCENFRWCARREMRRRRRVRQMRKRTLMVVLFVAVLVMAFMFFSKVFFAEARNKPETSGSISEEDKSTYEADPLISGDEEEESSSESAPDDAPEVPEVIEPVISATGPGEQYYYNLSYEDKVYMAMVVYVEARGEPYEGQVAVAATILNRFVSNDSRFDRESIYSIITQSGQYASIKSITEEDLESTPSCMKAVEDACKGWDPTRIAFEDGAKFFFNPNGLSESAKKEREGIDTYPIGSHMFHNEFAC